MFAAAWGYKKFNLKLDKKGYAIISVIAVVEVILTMLVTLNIACMVEIGNQGGSVSFFECFGLMFQVIGDTAELRNAVIVDGVLSLIFISIGILSFHFIEKKKRNQMADIGEKIVVEYEKTESPNQSVEEKLIIEKQDEKAEEKPNETTTQTKQTSVKIKEKQSSSKTENSEKKQNEDKK